MARNQSINQVYYFSSTLQARFHTKKTVEKIQWSLSAHWAVKKMFTHSLTVAPIPYREERKYFTVFSQYWSFNIYTIECYG